MYKNYFLSAVALLFGLGVQAQEDVTSKYITNPGFESCEATAPVTNDAGETFVDLYSTKGGTDYESAGWKLVEQNINANGAVVEYGNNIGYTGWGSTIYSAAGPAAGPEGTTGNKALCVIGSAAAVKYQTAEVELPAGVYYLTVHLNLYSGWQTEQEATSYSGFVPAEGAATLSTKGKFLCNAWDEDVIEIEVPVATKGRFQIGYTASFFAYIDDVKLTYENKVITTALEAVIVKAKAVSTALYDSDASLTAAIANAEAFVENPTSQEAVQTQIDLLYTAMSSALEQTFEPIDITGGYIENPSFETNSIVPWVSEFAAVATPSPYQQPQPLLDGTHYVYFGWQATAFSLEQTLDNLPEGYYLLTALGNTAPFAIYINDAEGSVTPSTGLFDLGFSGIAHITDGKAKIGAHGKDTFSADDFRLIYCTEEEQLNEYVFTAVAEAAQALLDNEDYAIVTGEERTALATAIAATEGTQAERIAAIQDAMATFASSKSSYQAFETAKTNAAAYTLEAYPYADPAIYEAIQALCATVATSASDAERLSQELPYICQTLVDSHYRLDGVTDKVSYTADITSKGWTLDGVEADATEGYYKHTDELYAANPAEGSMEVTLAGLPSGKYVFVCDSRAGYYLIPTLYVNGAAVAELPHTGMTVWQNGGYVDAWTKGIYAFDKPDASDLTLKVGLTFETNYPNYYHAEFGIGNILLYKIADLTEYTEVVNVERIVDQGYAAQQVTVDLATAKAFLGVDQLTTSMLRIINPDGSVISDYAPYDGWFNREGAAEYWGPNTFTNVKFFQAIPGGTYSICDMGGDRGSVAPVVGDEFSCKWALTANDKTYILQTNVTYIAAPPVELEVVDLGIVSSVIYSPSDASYLEKTVTLSDEQVNSILSELSLSSLTEAKVFGYNPTTEELIENYAGYDGWRDANGDFHNWTGTDAVPACVKYTDGKNYLCYNINGCEPQVVKCYWAIANDTKAVLVEIDFIYDDVTGIKAIEQQSTDSRVFDLQGRQVQNGKKGIFIQNGHKVVK